MTSYSSPGEEEFQISRRQARSVLFTALLIGIGVAGFLDETIFHQLLQWHTFYWATTQQGRILSDGLFHLFSTLLLLWALLRVWKGRTHWNEASGSLMIAGILMGAGGFNFYDGIVQHAIFHFHLVNEYICPTGMIYGNNTLASCPRDIPYEIIWDSIGFILLALGFLFWRQQRGKIQHTLEPER